LVHLHAKKARSSYFPIQCRWLISIVTC
jgi:hypothetical protein